MAVKYRGCNVVNSYIQDYDNNEERKRKEIMIKNKGLKIIAGFENQ